MKFKDIVGCSTLAATLCFAMTVPGQSQVPVVQKVIAVPETSFSSPSSLNIFDTYVTQGYPPTQLTLKNGNGVCDFVENPGFVQDGPPPICSTQLLAEKAPYTKVIPFGKQFSLHFTATQIQPNPVPPNLPAGPYGGTIFELHDTDPVFAKYGDPGTSGIRLVSVYDQYTFYSNNKAIWTGSLTPKVTDVFELSGVLQKNTSNVNDGTLTLKRNGVVIATSTGANCNGLTPTYPPVIGGSGGSTGPAPHPLKSGPHVRLGLGKVPVPMQQVPPTTTEYYIDNAGAYYFE